MATGGKVANPFSRKVIYISKVDGEVVRASCRASVEVAFEEKYHVGLNSAFDGEGSATRMYWLAFESERRWGRADGTAVPDMPSFEAWLDTVESIDLKIESSPFSAGPPATA
jgi:hypothetical protein